MNNKRLDVEFATEDDWPQLQKFFDRAYRNNHPLQREDFWRWRFGDARYGRSILAFLNGSLVGHAGAAVAGNHAWMINVWLGEEARGKGLLRAMYDLARTVAPLAAASVNRAGLDMYRNMGWRRYSNLQRYVATAALGQDHSSLLAPVIIRQTWKKPKDDHYWQQPGISGFQLADGSTAVDQLSQGGLRVIDLVDPIACAEEAFAAGVRWLDFVTSWNDPLCRHIDARYWVDEHSADVPWRLAPVESDTFADIAVLSERELPPQLIISRRFSDHGRVGSLPAQ